MRVLLVTLVAVVVVTPGCSDHKGSLAAPKGTGKAVDAAASIPEESLYVLDVEGMH